MWNVKKWEKVGKGAKNDMREKKILELEEAHEHSIEGGRSREKRNETKILWERRGMNKIS